MGPADDIALQARLRPGRLAARDLSNDRRWSFAELDEAVGRCAGLLRGPYGCAPGDRVAVIARNCVEQVILHHACARAALIFTPMNWRLNPAEIGELLAQAQPTLVIGDGEMIKAGVAGVDFAVFIAQMATAEPLAPTPIDPEQVSLILWTSGTSGKPKGVMLTERALAQTAINLGVLGQVTGDSAFLIDAPMFHVIGLITTVRPVLMRGGAIVVSDGFEPARTLLRLGDPGLAITHYFCVPQMADRLRAEPAFEPEALRGLTAIFTGGAPHAADSIRAWLAAGIPIVDGFGMSEAGTVFGMAIDREVIAAKAGSVGVGTPGVLSRLVGADGAPVPVGRPGELLLKGGNLFSGYWNRPEESSAAMTDDGWFRTGDIAVCDADGFFWIVDRKKDMFISGGENVYPAEIEAALVGMPGLVEAAVIGVPDEQWGEVGLCALVAEDPAGDLIERVRAHLALRLGRYKQPTHYHLVESLPRTGSGKVRKSELVAQLRR